MTKINEDMIKNNEMDGYEKIDQYNPETIKKIADKYQFYFRTVKYQAINFTKGMENAKDLRNELSKTNTVEEIKAIFSRVL